MRRAAITVALVLAASCASSPSGPTYRVRRVIDGDTIEVVDRGGIRTRVRLRRVDAPEMGERGGEVAARELRERLKGERVRLEPVARDVYGRVVAEVERASN